MLFNVTPLSSEPARVSRRCFSVCLVDALRQVLIAVPVRSRVSDHATQCGGFALRAGGRKSKELHHDLSAHSKRAI